MDELQRIGEDSFRERVRLARSMTFEEKLAESARLTELALEAMKAEIRADFPQADESEVNRVFELRIQLMRIAKGKLPGGQCRYPLPASQRAPGDNGGG